MARILIAEDETAVRTFIKRALAHKGHQVTEVCDGLQALQALGGQQFHLLITDIVMPGLDGIGLALRVARDHPKLPVPSAPGASNANPCGRSGAKRQR